MNEIDIEQKNNSSKLLDFMLQEEDASEETIEMFAEAGVVILESAVLRFLTNAEPEDIETFHRIVTEEHDVDTGLPILIAKLPTFATILKEEIQAFNTHANTLL